MNKRNVADIYGLSTMQEGMLFHSLKSESSSMYLEQFSCKLHGQINFEYFWDSWQKVINDHSALRTAFVWEGVKKPVQVVLKQCECSYIQYDWSNLPLEEIGHDYSTFLENDRMMGFELDKAPLMRFALIQISEDSYYFVWSFHHIIMDGWSLPLVLEEMFGNYKAFKTGEAPAKHKSASFKDYIHWLHKQDAEVSRQYWKEKLKGFEEALPLYTEPAVEEQKGETRKLSLRLSEDIHHSIEQITKNNGFSAYQLYNLAFAILLSRYSGKEDVVYGTTVSGRPAELKGIDQTVGIFINTIPVRVQLDGNLTLLECLENLTQDQISRSPHEYMSLAEISSAHNLPQLFQSIFVYENYANAQAYKDITEFSITELQLREEINYPLAWVVKPDHGILVETIYNSAYFSDRIIEEFQRSFITILDEMVLKINEAICTIQLLPSEQSADFKAGKAVSAVVNLHNQPIPQISASAIPRVLIVDTYGHPLPDGFEGSVWTPDQTASGYMGRYYADGTLMINETLSTSMVIGGIKRDLPVLERALRAESLVEDVKMLQRYNRKGESKLVVYYVEPVTDAVVEQAAFDEERTGAIRSAIADRLCILLDLNKKDCLAAAEFVPVSNIPYYRDGVVKINDLLELEIINDNLIQRWSNLVIPDEQSAMSEFPVKFVRKAVRISRDNVHISDLAEHFSFIKKKSSGKTDNVEVVEVRKEEIGADTQLSLIVGEEVIIPENTVFDLGYYIKRAADQAPEDYGIRFVNYDGSIEFANYKQVYSEAKAICCGLIERGLQPGDKVIYQMDNNRNYVNTFWACMLGGFIGIPATVAASYKEDNAVIRKLLNAWKMLEQPVIVTDEVLAESIRSVPGVLGGEEEFTVYSAEQLMNSRELEITYEVKPDDVALLLLTSGSTGMPKGVMQTHRNILRRTIAACQNNGFGPEEVTFNWMPMDHVGGIVMCNVRDIYLHCQEILAPVNYILEAPLRWLTLMSDFRATNTWAPNFAFNLINSLEGGIKELNIDLSALRFITNGGEVVVARTALKFNEILKPYHLDKSAMMPCFGMSETCSGSIYSTDFGQDVVKQEDSSVSVGRPLPGNSIRIVDAQNELVPLYTEGRFQMAGVCITPGYYNNPKANAEAFTSDGWFDTGDLGIITDRGLTITGRAKDIIIINGVNYNNSEIEAILEEIDGVEVSYTAAVSVKASGSQEEELAIFFHPVSMDAVRLKGIIKEMQKVITSKIGLVIEYIIPLAKKEIPKTGIGKIQRILLRDSLLAGKYDAVLKKLEIVRNKNTVKPWIFKKVWKPLSFKLEEGTVPCVNILVFEDRHGLAGEFIECMGLDETRVISVKQEDCFQVYDRNHYGCDYTRYEGCKELFDYFKQIGWKADHMIYLPTYQINASGDTDISSSSQLGVFSLIHLLQVLADNDLCASTSLYVGSSNVFQDAGGLGTRYDNAALIGFMATLDTENTGLRSLLIDLEGRDIKQDARLLRAEIMHGETAVKEISYRDGRRLTWKLRNVPLRKAEPKTRIKQGGNYVVTGGLGGIGTKICSQLIENYQANLLILGRSDLGTLEDNDSRVQHYNQLVALGTSISYRQADVCDLDSIVQAVEDYEQSKGIQIDGIIHLAGNSSYQRHFDNRDSYLITAIEQQTFAEEFNAKVYGVLNLFELLKSRKEAMLITFSSVTSLLGSATFSAYAAGNSFLEMFCKYAAGQLGYAVKCISWTMWDKIGMTAGSLQSINSLSESIGQHVISEQDGLLFFEALLNLGDDMVYVGIDENNVHISHRIDEKVYAKEYLAVYRQEDTEALLQLENAKVLDDYGAVSTLKMLTVNRDGEVIEEEQAEPYVEASTDAERIISNIWSEVLAAGKIGMNDNFFELGGHSLKATQVVSRIKKEYGIEFAINDLFYHPTVGALAKLVEERVRPVTDSKGEGPLSKLSDEEKKQGIPASYAQQRLWFLKQYDEESAFYNILETIRLKGELNVSCLQQAVTEIVKRHEGLRTTFDNIEGQIMQVLHDVDTIEIPLQNLMHVEEEAREQVITELADEEVHQEFDFRNGPLIRCKLLKFAADEHVIFLTMHHIISDGWSMGVFVHEFVELYDALVNQKPAELPKIEWQYADYTQWQRDWFTGKVKEDQFVYWKNKLKDVATLDIPSDYDRPKVQTFNGKKDFFVYNKSMMDRVNELAETTGATPFMIYLAAVDVLFARYTGQDDIAIGTPIANRTRMETENTIGFFVNTLVLRNDLSGDISFLELIERVKTSALESYDAQDMPFEMLVDELELERDLSRNPLFQVMFSLQNEALPDFKLPNLAITRVETDNKSAMFDFWISMRELEDGVHTLCEYNTDIYKTGTIRKMMRHLENIINSLCADPYQKIKQFNFMDKEEINEILYEHNKTDYTFEKELFIHELFEEQALLRPDAPALKFQGDTLTYLEFNMRVNQVAHYLIAQGIGTEDFVGVYADRSIEMMVAVYGILKAGAAYIPIDPTYPRDRVDYMLQDSEVKLVLYCMDEIDALAGIRKVDLRDKELFLPMSTDNPGVKVEGTQAAYMIYTSGSTGKPKGTINIHSGIRNRIVWGQKEFGMQPGDRQVQKTPFSFDVSCSEIFWALTIGACLVIAKPEGHKDVEYLAQLIRDEQITIAHFVPSILKLFLEHPGAKQAGSSLRKVFCSGEALPYRLKEQFFQTFDAGLYNLYGPTEASVEVSYYDCSEQLDKEIVPIGKPISNVQLYVLDEYMNPVPYNVSGELFIAGVNLARGYYKRDDLTAEKFISNPFSKYVGARMYRTGDIVKLLPDGNINFIGRADNQVKVRGLRIELGEIEKVIQSHPSVKDNVVINLEDGNDVRIVSYIVRDVNYREQDVTEESKEQVTQWESIFDNAYNKEETIQDFSLNTISWNSSYTGEKLGIPEMEEWLTDSVDLIKSFKPRRVLEVGCGTGMILFKIAPLCEEYVGIDLSRIGLDYIERNLDRSMNVRLYQKSADELGELQNETFDTIIINSVIQYFPSGAYLNEVITTLLGMLNKEGTLFIGDVRSLPLLKSYHTSVEWYKAPADTTVQELNDRIKNSITAENELLVDSKYFLSLKDSLEQVEHVSILPKVTKFENEMSKFRYQVVIRTKEAEQLDNIVQFSWRNIQAEQGLQDILTGRQDDVIVIHDVQFDKLVHENKVESLLNDHSVQAATVRELREDVRELQLYAPSLYDLLVQDGGNYRLRALWNGHGESGDYQLILFHKNKYGADTCAYDYEVPNFIRYNEDQSVYFTNPLEWKDNHKYIPVIREHIRSQLQDYMIPSFFIVLPEMPLLPNGKLNKKMLPEPGRLRRSVMNEFVEAANDNEAKVKRIWEAVLNARNIGVNDNFFDIGGHSLLVVQVYYKIKESFDTNITVVDMFKYPTIRSLCEYLEETTSSYAEVASASEVMETEKEAMKVKRKRLKELLKR
ncbi:linear gramicidin synthetase subunit D [Paenibacillus sp. FSL R7-277]|uniref:non-ribosomal peptide synthetase n=1 Tax=Paenibacillus sp. FSL R7-277 TaxID=1227352 RepID=UPI0003E2447A|nr:non-ribosomal peptide synthetase [Paenibacillus sp. FSL R7-277]ETT73269.1 linear gramicidin synthetase subunit D [Paenibacillus sp. FSL R7-277]